MLTQIENPLNLCINWWDHSHASERLTLTWRNTDKMKVLPWNKVHRRARNLQFIRKYISVALIRISTCCTLCYPFGSVWLFFSFVFVQNVDIWMLLNIYMKTSFRIVYVLWENTHVEYWNILYGHTYERRWDNTRKKFWLRELFYHFHFLKQRRKIDAAKLSFHLNRIHVTTALSFYNHINCLSDCKSEWFSKRKYKYFISRSFTHS